MIKKNNKKGSQVSFIISFALFISFLIFFIGLVKPFQKIEIGKESLLTHLEGEIIKNTSEEVLVISALEDSSSDCAEIDSLNIENYKTNKTGNLLKIYSSDSFPANTFPCAAPPGYKIGLIRPQNYVLESKFLKLNESYSNNYDFLKENFGIPNSNDFEFSLLDINENAIIKPVPKEIPPEEVLAKLISINYLNENVEIKSGYLRVVLW